MQPIKPAEGRPRVGVSLSKQNVAFVQPIPVESEPSIGLSHEGSSPVPLSARRRPRRPRKVVQSFSSPFCLDGFMLIQCAGVRDPQDAQEASVCGRGLTSVNKVDLSYFSEIVAMDADENQLTFESLAILPLLELRMRCNNLVNLQFEMPGYTCLKVLDVSFNKIDPDSLVELSKAPNLVQLSLASNQLTWLPEGLERLHSLQVLDLESNFLNTKSSIARLALIPRLQTLNLSANGLQKWYAVPAGGFPSLSQLSISRNAIEDVDDVVCGLSRNRIPGLRHLRCWSNPFCDGLSQEEYRCLSRELAAGTELEMRLEVQDPLDMQPLTLGVQLAALSSRRTTPIRTDKSRLGSQTSSLAATPPLGRPRPSPVPVRAWHGTTLGFTRDVGRPISRGSPATSPEPRNRSTDPKRVFAELRASLVGSSSIGSCIGSKQPGYLKGTRRKPSRTKRMVPPSHGGHFPGVASSDSCRGLIQHDNGKQRLVEKCSQGFVNKNIQFQG